MDPNDSFHFKMASLAMQWWIPSNLIFSTFNTNLTLSIPFSSSCISKLSDKKHHVLSRIHPPRQTLEHHLKPLFVPPALYCLLFTPCIRLILLEPHRIFFCCWWYKKFFVGENFGFFCFTFGGFKSEKRLIGELCALLPPACAIRGAADEKGDTTTREKSKSPYCWAPDGT